MELSGYEWYNHSYWWYSCNDDVMLLHSWEVPWPQVTFRLCSSSDQPPWSPECGMKPLGAEQTFPLVFLFNHKAVEHSMDFAGPRILQSGTANPAPPTQQVWETDVMGKKKLPLDMWNILELLWQLWLMLKTNHATNSIPVEFLKKRQRNCGFDPNTTSILWEFSWTMENHQAYSNSYKSSINWPWLSIRKPSWHRIG